MQQANDLAAAWSTAATVAPPIESPRERSSEGRRRWIGWFVVGVLVGLIAWAEPVAAQHNHLAERYRAARLQLKANQLLEQYDRPFLPPRPVQSLPVPTDSLLRDSESDSDSTESEAGFHLAERQVVRKLERTWFQQKYADRQWAFLGASRYVTQLDTTYTRELRARLQAQFGDPTQTVADFQPDERPEELLQFEYWFVVNDSIPVRISDVAGPRERGLIVSTDQRYRDQLFDVRDAVLQPVIESDSRAPYVDYYYDRQFDDWYRTGFDGTEFFMESIRPSDVTPGRRPWLDSRMSDERPRR